MKINPRIFLRSLCALVGHESRTLITHARLEGGGRYAVTQSVVWCARCGKGKP